jgi:sec-independent protein translocase protein TatA
MNFGATEILLVLLVVLLLFGGKRLPELARTIGRGLADFRRAAQDVQREISAPLSDTSLDKPLPDKPASSDREQTAVHADPSAQSRTSQEPPASAS